MDALGPWHLVIIAAFFALLFGAKRLPDAARSLGRSARIMKSELKGLHEQPEGTESPVSESPVTESSATVQSASVPPVVLTRPLVAEELPVPARNNGTH